MLSLPWTNLSPTGPYRRIGSPSRLSIFTTRAPSSASNAVDIGVAIHVESSSTVTPCRSGRAAGEREGGGAGGAAETVKSGPSCRVGPSAGSSISVESPVWTSCGWASASPGRMNGSADTSGSAANTDCHSSQVRSPTRSSTMARNAAVGRIPEARRGAEPLVLPDVLELERAEECAEERGTVLAELDPHAVARAADRVHRHRRIGDTQGVVGALGPSRDVEHGQPR